jgi:predicted acylesterase/phospholipase RssA
MTPTTGSTTSLTLTGGGSYAAYEVGVMKALFSGDSPATAYTPFDPDVLVGTSGGAVNAAALVACEVRAGSLVAAVEELRTFWIERIAEGPNVCGNGVYRIKGLPFSLLRPACLWRGLAPMLSNATDDAMSLLRGALQSIMNFAESSDSPVQAAARLVNISVLVSLEPFLESLREVVPQEDFGLSTRQLRVVAMDVNTGRLRLFTQDDVRRLGHAPILASAAIPIFFSPHQIEGHVYANGNTLASTPLLPAILESDTTHIVYMDPAASSISSDRVEDIVDAMDRVLLVNFSQRLNREFDLAQELNTALKLIEDGVTVQSLAPLDVHALLRSMARIRDRIQAGNPYRPLTIHRYHPRDDLGGDLGVINFDRKRITELIDRGYAETVAHDCAASNCLLPGRRALPSRQRSRSEEFIANRAKGR